MWPTMNTLNKQVSGTCGAAKGNVRSNRVRAAAGALGLAAAAGLLLAAPLCFAGGISNLRVSQRAGTNLVDLRYDLATGGEIGRAHV